MLIDGSSLASQAKHTPELVDMNDVRTAGRIIERYEELLRGMYSHTLTDDGVVVSFRIDGALWEQVAYDAFS